ncbi:hypothetical protein J4E85_010068 [Alternaria conjuncta]|uniref:uncharacterized protein n=1 Tax=Alternaria conjuncta TaxID=181017 RepID=UPI0022212A47|nr:uncharacterized protein J4E85_010068 [Alternaria conjuncta]KAI4916414.1 hypothetical protein J4E85_010068 [Alternaria conjuncta]
MTRDMNQAIQIVNTLQNPSSVRDISFREDVEAFALNVSLIPVNVTTSTSAVVYAYNPQNLLLSYGLAILASTISIAFGLFAMWKNGACYDNRMSTFGTAMQGFDVKEVFEDSKTRAAQPLRGQAAKTKLMFDAEEGFVLGHRKRPSGGSSIGTPITEEGFVLGHRKRPSEGSNIGTPIRE